ncbi:MAG TPA: thioredoxin family protein [Candidatus Baltobacteraceae bacterium]|jgi:predicted dithiol-disulfide oxidoreductase (DUF899 family)
MSTNTVSRHHVATREQWLEQRLQLLKEEKELTRRGDELARRRRELPWVRIDKEYRFETPDGSKTLAELFDGCSQLLVYHFMFGPDWDEACKSCSFWIDNVNGVDVHLRHRDVRALAISHAPLPKLEAYKKRMGWSFPFASSYGSDFNYDFGVSFDPKDLDGGVVYNYVKQKELNEEMPGVSAFVKTDDGSVYHTYSAFGRGLDRINGAYQLLDLTPKGRDEDGLEWPMEWLRRQDQY